MRTKGSQFPLDDSPPGDCELSCDFCGGRFRRAEMHVDGDGYLVCYLHDHGLSRTELDDIALDSLAEVYEYPTNDVGHLDPLE